MIVEFDIYTGNKGKITCPQHIMDAIRARLSIVNKNAEFLKRHTGRSAPRIYAITPSGRFEIGMFKQIKSVIDGLGAPVKYKYSDEFRKACVPQFPCHGGELANLGLSPYDYQEDSVRKMLRYGRGTILIGTGGGKTFIMSLFAKTVKDFEHSTRFLVIVPTLQLVEQTYSDFLDYGFPSEMVSKWSGKCKFQNTDVIIASASILQSKLSDLTFLKEIDVLMVDEVHILKKSNGINKIIDKIPTHNRFGFTGTMPEETEDIWNVLGKIGPVLYEKNSDSLRGGQFITDCRIDIIKVHYNHTSLTDLHRRMEEDERKYIAELEFTMEHAYRNELICKTATVARDNTLIMVDRIAHGELIRDILENSNSRKKIYFIQGDVKIDERERVREIMETEDNVICVAISKIFSTGINIKNIHNIIFATPGKAKVKLIQSIGRGLRLHENKSILRVFDFADNLHYSNRHLQKREKLYLSEKLNYEIRNIKEQSYRIG